ncbi:MAG: hypothetical protein FWF95_06340 [Syntrophorhabdaceae bacterium]|nr:hypothetical protein [Syntrophorhabdaceae bacterium]
MRIANTNFACVKKLIVWPLVLLLAALSGVLLSHIVDKRSFLDRQRLASMEASGAGNLMTGISLRPEFALGFRNAMADIVWLQAVQVAGNMKMTHGDYSRLYSLLDVATNFDPRFDVPYLLGGLILGESPDHGAEALRILDRGSAQFPDDWQYPFYKGYTLYFNIGDYAAAGEEMARASRLPGSSPYLPSLASRMLAEGNEPETAIRLLASIIEKETDDSRRLALERRMREVLVERDLQMLERAVEAYHKATGAKPLQLRDLVVAGILPVIPVEPNGGNYILEQGGGVRSDQVARRLHVLQKKR